MIEYELNYIRTLKIYVEEDNNRNAIAQRRSEQLNDQVENRNGDRDNVDARKGTSINITTIVLVNLYY